MEIILMSLVAGSIGMGAGGLLTALFASKTEKMTSIFLSFAGGVMISIVFLELVPESIELANIPVAVIGIILGALMVLALHYIMDKLSGVGNGSKLHETFAEFFHSGDVISEKKSMLRSGLVMLFAIGLHNVPEGLALGAAGHYDASLGLTLAILIALHNIPEGMAVTAPLVAGGVSKVKSVLLTFLVGSITVLGAIAGVLIGGISDLAVALSFAIAGGAMLYVVVGEILPHSIVVSKDRMPTIFAMVGIVVGMLFIAIVA